MDARMHNRMNDLVGPIITAYSEAPSFTTGDEGQDGRMLRQREATASTQMKLNLGCGTQIVDGWLNVDYSLGARLAKVPVVNAVVKTIGLFEIEWNRQIFIHDLTRRFPWPDNTADVVYTSHTLEHMSLTDGAAFLHECVRVLKPGGILRIVVPDLRPIAQRYLADELLAENFLDEMCVLYSKYPSRLKTWLAPFVQYPHKCMYDKAALARACWKAGIGVTDRLPFDSGIEDIYKIEIESRTMDAVIIEGRK